MDKPIAGLPEPTNEPGVVAASVYAGGRRVADITVDEAGAVAKKPGHVVWIGLLEPIRGSPATGASPVRPPPACHRRCRKGPSASQAGTVRRRALRRGPDRPDRGRADRVRRDPHLRRSRLCRFGAPRRVNVLRGRARALRSRARPSSPTARTTSSTPSSISSSTTTCLSWRRSRARSRRSRTACSTEPLAMSVRSIASTCCGASCCACAKPSRRSSTSASDWSMPTAVLIDPQMQPLFRDVSDHIRRVQEDIDCLREVMAFAFEASLMAGRRSRTPSPAGSPPGPPSWPCRRRSPASTA